MSALEKIDTVTRLQLDVTSVESIKKCKEYVETSTGGRLDILVNNAGISYTSAAIEMDVNTAREVFEANVFSVMEMNKAFAPLLIKAKGIILSTGSVAGLMPNPFGGIYHTSKAALHMYSDCLRQELEPFGVRVITAVTGGVQSNIAANAQHRFKLPANSFYAPVEKDMQARLTTSQHEGTCPRDEYARDVVTQVLYEHPPRRIYKGRFAWSVWFLITFLPYSWTSWIMSRRFGMLKFRKMLGN